MPTINDSIQYLKGVGPAFAKKFEKLGINTIRDLLLCYPRKYIDYTQPYTIVAAPYDVECCVRATVLQKEPARRIKGGRALNARAGRRRFRHSGAVVVQCALRRRQARGGGELLF